MDIWYLNSSPKLCAHHKLQYVSDTWDTFACTIRIRTCVSDKLCMTLERLYPRASSLHCECIHNCTGSFPLLITSLKCHFRGLFSLAQTWDATIPFSYSGLFSSEAVFPGCHMVFPQSSAASPKAISVRHLPVQRF